MKLHQFLSNKMLAYETSPFLFLYKKAKKIEILTKWQNAFL